MTDVVVLDGVGRRFGAVDALRDASLAVPAGQFVAVMGATGSGKSTYWVAGIAGAGGLVLAGTVVPAALATRVRPVEAAG